MSNNLILVGFFESKLILFFPISISPLYLDDHQQADWDDVL